MNPRRVAVVGGGWAGIAAAVHARLAGHRVSLFEMAPRLGGRARSVDLHGQTLDNGQHILVGAYTACLELMGQVGANPRALLLRRPLVLRTPDGHGLQLRGGAPLPDFARAVLTQRGWGWGDRLRLLATAGSWAARGFRCDDALSVAELCRRLPEPVRRDLIEPMCVAALNTPAQEASAAVFLRVLRDALFAGPGSSDLLLPCTGLQALVPGPADHWLRDRGAEILLRRRVGELAPDGPGWRVDDRPFDAVVMACTATEAARLCRPVNRSWADQAAALHYEPIVTVYLRGLSGALPLPMVALRASPTAPAQFAFDLGVLGGPAGVAAFVVSGAAPWLEHGQAAIAEATCAQALSAFGPGAWTPAPQVHHVAAERRATFRCTPGLRRPPARIASGLWAAGDYVAGPYPATLEGAVRSGRSAAAAL